MSRQHGYSETEIVDLTESDGNAETVASPPPPPGVIEILDTSRAARVWNHDEIPAKVLASFVRGYQRYRIDRAIPAVVVEWCFARFSSEK